jgi:DNA-binding NtrC family response regulator
VENYSLLLVDDDPFILEGIGDDLEGNGYRVSRAESGEIALAMLESINFDLVITDLIMDRTNGIQVLKKTKELNPAIQVIILTGFGDINSAIAALRNQADDFLLKPCESQEMLLRIRSCLEKRKMARQIRLYQKILPMCCVCKKIRDDTGKKPGMGEWIKVEKFIHEQVDLDITSSYCPECAQKTLAEFSKKIL